MKSECAGRQRLLEGDLSNVQRVFIDAPLPVVAIAKARLVIAITFWKQILIINPLTLSINYLCLFAD